MRRSVPTLTVLLSMSLSPATSHAVTAPMGAAPGNPPGGQSDFNGDGFADLPIGVPGQDVSGVADAGAVNVIYGSAGGLSATAIPDQVWSQSSPSVEGSLGEGDGFGSAVAAGDFDGDAYADLAVGVPGEDEVGVGDAGSVNVIYGSAGGLSATAARPDQLFHQDSPDVEGQNESGDDFGRTVATGDFNGDGFADLVVGAPRDSGNDAGAVHVVYGSPQGLSATATPDQVWHQDVPDVEDAREPNDRFGSSLAAANFGGGAEYELAIGTPGERVDGSALAGAVSVLYGSPAGLSATATPDQIWSLASPDVNGAPRSNDRFGWALAAGDLGGGGQADLAVGAPFEDAGQVSDAGTVHVIYGAPGGLSATATPDQVWTQDSPSVEGVAQPFDRFGSALVSANFGSSPHADLAVGAPFESVSGLDGAGAVHVLYGSPSGLSATARPDQLWTQDTADVNGSATEGDAFGHALAAADYGASAQSDLAVGVPGDPAGALTDAGAVNVLYGSPGGLSATAVPDQRFSEATTNVEGNPGRGDRFGASVAPTDG